VTFEGGNAVVAEASLSSLQVLQEIVIRGAEFLQASKWYGLALWGCACLIGMLSFALGLTGMSRLVRDSVAAEGTVIARAEHLARVLALRSLPRVRVHATLDQPCLCGIFRSAILLPAPWLSRARPEMLNAVLAHELAHFKRRDALWNGLQHLLDTGLYFHPGVRWLSRSLRREREIAADLLAVQITGDRLALARALESVAHLCAGRRFSRQGGAAFRGPDPTLLPRIQELLGMTPRSPRFRFWPPAAFSLAVVLAVVTASVGFARDEASPGKQTQPPVGDSEVVSIAVEEQDRQISYEVRFIETEPDAWRQAVKGELKPLSQEAQLARWMIDGKDSLDRLIRSVIGRPTSKITTAPKPTMFEGHHVVFTVDTRVDGRIQPLTTIRLGGMFSPSAIRMSVDLKDSSRGSPRQQSGASEKNVEVRLKDSFEIPNGSSLILSLYRHLRFIDNRNVTIERLVVITPRRIDLLVEEMRNRPDLGPSRSKP
jgi:hypothetical protein